MKDVCFWSVGNGDFASMVQGLVRSFRRVGMDDDFIAFCDRPIEGAETILIPGVNKKDYLFKFHYLRMLQSREYKTFVFLDADSLFVRKPPPLLPLMCGSPVHAFFESDCSKPALRKSWWGCPLDEYVQMMRDCGVGSECIYNVNAGFFMVERHSIEVVCGLVNDFWRYALGKGVVLTEEAPLAYAVHMLCVKPEDHLLSDHFDVWATDWTAQFAERLPDGRPWVFKDWLRGQEHTVNPAIVHALKSKELLILNSSRAEGQPPGLSHSC